MVKLNRLRQAVFLSCLLRLSPPGEAFSSGCEWGSHGAPIAPDEKTSHGAAPDRLKDGLRSRLHFSLEKKKTKASADAGSGAGLLNAQLSETPISNRGFDAQNLHFVLNWNIDKDVEKM